MFTNEKYIFFTSPTTGKRYFFRASGVMCVKQTSTTQSKIFYFTAVGDATGTNVSAVRVTTDVPAAEKIADQITAFLSTPYTETTRELVFDGFQATSAE